MLSDMRIQTQIHWNRGFKKNGTHYLGLSLRADLVKQLSEAADLEMLPNVYSALCSDIIQDNFNGIDDIIYKYNIIDANTFEKHEN